MQQDSRTAGRAGQVTVSGTDCLGKPPPAEPGWVDGVVQVLTAVLASRDPEVGEHTQRVVRLALAIGAEMALDAKKLQILHWAACLHDLGKIAVPDQILHKPEPLSAGEWRVMRQHPVTSYKVATGIPGLPADVLTAILQHHERWNGQGYPFGLGGERIHWAARVLAVADSADAIMAGRVYQPARSATQACQEIGRLRGTWYDPVVVDAFQRVSPAVLDWRRAVVPKPAVDRTYRPPLQ